jgi:DNA-binding response OmpR family regulator/anti-sigma regulatory factor (Ser/Thr protein kinase)
LSKDLVIELDRNKIEKVINNLISNALKFTPKDGRIQVSLVQVSDTSYLEIKVKDSGRGIHPDDLKHIFERYFQSKTNTALEGGTGIGLALTKELVELMDGTISVHSEVGKGTVFEIKMPYQLAVDSEQNTVDSEQLAVTNLRGFQNLRDLNQPKTSTEKDTILLVEDNPSLQEFVYSILEPYYNVTITGNGVEALEQLATGNWQLVLSDVMMPEMDGFTLLEKVKTNDDFCSIPFILLTARADIQDKLHGLRIGVDDYMTKPFEVEELLLRIRNLITNSKNRVFEIDEEEVENTPALTAIPRTAKKKVEEKIIEKVQITSADIEWLSQVETIVKRELRNKQFTIDLLADEIFVSKRQFARKVKLITGLPPGAYVRNIRLQEARKVFETEETFTVSEVSYRVGFENVSHFSKLFKKEFGKRPQEYLSR